MGEEKQHKAITYYEKQEGQKEISFYRYSFFYALTINKQKKDFILNWGLVNNTNTKTKT